MAESNELVFNVAFTVPINDDPAGPILTLEEFWRGLRRGGEKPHLFAEYVADTEVLPGRKSENEFTRRLIMADGAVHTAKGVALEQNVRNADNLLTEAITIDSGARSTMLISRGGRESDKPTDLFLTAAYELHVPGVVSGSDRAKEIQEEYSLLARGAARTVVAKIREWKSSGTLEE
ncbi:hypothetical protein CNMCM8980_010024 [Aspergillus fumigatiaffinis]|uniref:Uncharacterized protein n=1 Tax=Aspergillus fumigatiaffinis TaxID=340414 RepID=A0A8H4GKW4_9EURO|nr:hypothetical protein CNMCM5878_001822 [Aspergillus fumigatiaffinis]KAF4223934.1 hypothetical protein CNMCM6457_010042 [Aspergillus fumigatiaffinis]KAF4234149.1 hypothetical protein CNMCM6805_008855 [Aspergillus fumigatiaffinis]KAF4244578.1 hypothetical protein CNMCM8980_010024 [Aspergillus fumigatiaffinis]